MRRIIATALLAGSLLASGSAHAAIESKAYVGIVGERTVVCLSQVGAPDAGGAGGACFSVSPGAPLHILLDDAVVARPSFRVGFYGDSGRIGDLHVGCGDLSMAAPAGATFMRVFVGLGAACPDGTTGDTGTAGWITVVK